MRTTIVFEEDSIENIGCNLCSNRTNTRLTIEEADKFSGQAQLVLEDEGNNWFARSFNYCYGRNGEPTGRYISFNSQAPSALWEVADNMQLDFNDTGKISDTKIESTANTGRSVTNILWSSCIQQ